MRQHQADQHLHYGVPQGGEKEAENMFEEIMARNFLKEDKEGSVEGNRHSYPQSLEVSK